MTAHTAATMSDMTAEFLDAITAFVPAASGDEKRYLTGAVGHDGYFDSSGTYTFDKGKFKQFAYEWPAQRDEAVAHIQRWAPKADAYICPYLMKSEDRHKGNAAWRQIIHSDVDGGVDVAEVRKLGGFIVWSGTPGHGHVYVLLEYVVRQEQHEILCEGLRDYLGADSKVRDNDLLRPVGAYNHKPTLNGGRPELVMPEFGGYGTPIPMADLCEILGVDITNLDGRKDQAHANGSQADINAREAVDPIPPAVQDALDNPVLKADGSVDKSETTFHVVCCCEEAGLELEQARWVIDQDADLAARVAGFLARKPPVDDVQISYERAKSRNWMMAGAGAQQAAGGQQQAFGAPSLGGVYDLTDARIGAYIAHTYLADEYLYSGAFGWMRYDGRRWKPTADAIIAEVIRRSVLDIYAKETLGHNDTARLKAISALFSASRMSAIMRVAKGYLAREGDEFDTHLHLLNVGNGVVDLRDGSLGPHDSKLMFTKVTTTEYHAGATHPDWDKALTAVSPEEAAFLQDRFGQGLTGLPPPDDRLIVFKGSGENGKSTLVDGVNGAAGSEYAIPLPDRVLLATTGQHPTELMELLGARIGFLEEFPEIGHLNV